MGCITQLNRLGDLGNKLGDLPNLANYSFGGRFAASLENLWIFHHCIAFVYELISNCIEIKSTVINQYQIALKLYNYHELISNCIEIIKLYMNLYQLVLKLHIESN